MGQFDVAEDILKGTFQQSVKEEQETEMFDVASEILSGGTKTNKPLPLGVKQSSAISTVTTKPIMEIDETSPKSADFSTKYKARLNKNEDTKIKIYADARRISPDRYKVVDGKIAFEDDTGQLRYEEDSGVGSDNITSILASATQPNVVAGSVGAAFGPATAVAGGMAGETLRQVVSQLVFGDDRTAKQNLVDLGIEGTLGLLTEFGGRATVGTINYAKRIGRGKGAILLKNTGAELEAAGLKEAARLQRVAKDYGIDLWEPQALKNRRMIAAVNLLRDMPQTADKVQLLDTIQNNQVEKAIPRFIKKISNPDDPYTTGVALKRASSKAISGLKRARSEVAGPIYEEAKKEGKDFSVDGILKYIDDTLTDAKAEERTALLKIKEQILNPDTSEAKPLLYDFKGNKIEFKEDAKKLNISQGISLKKSLDKRVENIGKPNTPSVDNTIKNELYNIKNMLEESMESSSEKYKLANATWAMMSKDVTRAQEGLLGKLAYSKGDDLTDAVSFLLSTKKSTPETIGFAKKNILSQKGGREIWDNAVGNYLQYTFDNLQDVSAGGGLVNIGGRFNKAVFGRPNQRKRMLEALGPDRYETVKNFFDVLEATGTTFKGESTTAVRQEMLEGIRSKNKVLGSFMEDPGKIPYKLLLREKANQLAFDDGLKKLADALFDPEASRQLAKLKQLSPGSEQQIKGLLGIMGLTAIEEQRYRMNN